MASKMSEKFRRDRKIGSQNMFYKKCINVIIDSIGPLIILRSISYCFQMYNTLSSISYNLRERKNRHKVTLVLEIKHSKCVVSCIILPCARGKMIQYTEQNDTVRLFSSQNRIFKT